MNFDGRHVSATTTTKKTERRRILSDHNQQAIGSSYYQVTVVSALISSHAGKDTSFVCVCFYFVNLKDMRPH